MIFIWDTPIVRGIKGHNQPKYHSTPFLSPGLRGCGSSLWALAFPQQIHFVHSKNIKKRQESPNFCHPRQKGGELSKGKSTQKPRNLGSGRNWGVCAIAHFVWDCICSWNQPCGWDTAMHIHCPADSLWLQSSQTGWNYHSPQDHLCSTLSVGQCSWDLCNSLYMCWRHHLHVGRDMYKISHPVSNGLPDVQKSLTIVQNPCTPPRQDCQVEKVDVSKKTQMAAYETKEPSGSKTGKKKIRNMEMRREWEEWEVRSFRKELM